MKLRRSIAGFMAVFVLCFSVIVPVREARAIVPAVLAMAIVDAAGAVLASDALLATGTSILGGIAMAAIFLTPGDSAQQISVPLTKAASDAGTVVPAPSAPATAIQSPGGSQTVEHGFAYGIEYDSMGACEAASCAMSIAACEGWGNTNCQCSGPYCSAVMVNIESPPSCPSGYTVSGSGCVLSSPRKAVSDGRSDLFVNSSGGISWLSWHADKDAPPKNASLPSDCNGCGRIWGTNANGQPFVTTITPNASGGSDIVTQTQYSSAGSTGVRTDAISVSPSGVVSSGTSTSSPGSISTSGADGVAPTVQTSGRTASDPIVFPDDYARQGTQVQVAANTQSIADAFKTPATGVENPVIPGTSDFEGVFFKGFFDNLTSWVPPSHSSACPTSSFDAFGETFTFNAHCHLVDNNFAAVRQAMAVVYLLIAMFIVLRA